MRLSLKMLPLSLWLGLSIILESCQGYLEFKSPLHDYTCIMYVYCIIIDEKIEQLKNYNN